MAEHSRKTQLIHSFYLFLASLIWGLAFVFQATGGAVVGAYAFNCLRYVIGAAVLAVFLLARGKELRIDRITLTGGICCGFFLAIASTFQQMGILLTNPGKAGFITSFYVVLVPIAALLTGKRFRPSLALAMLLALAGLYLICMPAGIAADDGGSIGKGDFLCLMCSLVFSLQIMTVDHFAGKTDAIRLSMVEFASAAVFSSIPMFLTGIPALPQLFKVLPELMYMGILSTGVAYTLQVVGQKGVSPVMATLLMSLEACFSVLFSWLLLGNSMSGRELAGCGLMLAAILAAELL